MHLITKPNWAISENKVTDEVTFLNRRNILASGLGFAMSGTFGNSLFASNLATNHILDAPKNFKFSEMKRKITDENINTKYNNFYEFGSTKYIANEAEALETEGWTIKVDGLVEKPFKVSVDKLITTMALEERIYRHRCVEAWSMVVPWTGFELSNLLKISKPLSSAKFIKFYTFYNPKVATEQKARWYPWPYTEGLTIEEASNPLSFMVVGAYGKILHKPFGAPIRLHLPWKYGFKSIKSIVRIEFTENRPVSFWEELNPNEYGFWANVNPKVNHPRWSQERERVLGGAGETIPTKIFNGYGAEVAHLYKNLESSEGLRLYR